MTTSRRAAMALFALAGVMAHGRAPACEVPVAEDPRLGAEWRTAIASVRAQLAKRDDCGQMMLAIVQAESGARVIATDAAGVRAERHVGRPSELRAIVRGLVASLPRDADADGEAGEADAAQDAEKVQGSTDDPLAPSAAEIPPPDEAPAAPKVKPAKPPVLFAGLALGARFGFPTRVLGADLKLHGDWLIGDGWMVTVFVRGVPLGEYVGRRAIPAFAYEEITLGIGAGKRFAMSDGVRLDVSLAPEVAYMNEEGDVPADGVGGSDQELRVVAGARLVLGRGPWRPFVAADGELAPFAAGNPAVAAPSLPSLPTWTTGLAFGMMRDVL